MSKIEKDIKEIETKLNSPEAKIREHCQKIRSQIDLNTEMIIERINSHRDELFKEVNSYEQMCIKSLKPIEKKERFQRIVSENEQQLREYQAYINRPRVDESHVKQMTNDAKIQEYLLKNCLQKINNKLFGDKLISFEDLQRQLETSVIGRCNYESLSSDNTDLIDMDRVVNKKIEKSIQYKADRVIPLTGDKYLVSVAQQLRVIDDAAQSFVEIRFDHEPIFFAHNGLDSIFVAHNRNLWKNSLKYKSPFTTLSVYDFNLNLKLETTPEYSVMAVTSTPTAIYAQIDGGAYVIDVYNWSLEKQATLGQTIYADKPYYFREMWLKLVKNDRIYFAGPRKENKQCVRSVSLSTGQLISEYYVSVASLESLFIDALSRTIVVDDKSSSLKIFDKPSSSTSSSGSNQVAELLFETELELNGTEGHHMTNDGRFFFVKDKQAIQFYSFCKA